MNAVKSSVYRLLHLLNPVQHPRFQAPLHTAFSFFPSMFMPLSPFPHTLHSLYPASCPSLRCLTFPCPILSLYPSHHSISPSAISLSHSIAISLSLFWYGTLSVLLPGRESIIIALVQMFYNGIQQPFHLIKPVRTLHEITILFYFSKSIQPIDIPTHFYRGLITIKKRWADSQAWV